MSEVLSVYGRIHVPPDPSDLIRRALEHHGEWAYIECELLGSLLRPGSFVIDAGACIGTFSLGLSQISCSDLIAVEPGVAAFQLLQKNLQACCPTKWMALNVGLGPESGKAELRHTDPTNIGASCFGLSETEHSGCSPTDDNKVNIVTLYELRQRFGVYDLVKLDMEGGEYDALRGDAVWIKDNRPFVWAECNESARARKLLQFFLWAELEPIYVAFPVFRSESFNHPAAPMFPIAYEAALLGGPQGTFQRLKLPASNDEIIALPVTTYEELRKALWLTPRWGKSEWTRLTRAQLVALIGRMSQQQDYCAFLPEPSSDP